MIGELIVWIRERGRRRMWLKGGIVCDARIEREERRKENV